MTQLIDAFRNFANIRSMLSQTDETRDKTHKYLKSLTPLTPSVQKNVNQCHGFKLVYKPRNIYVLFNQCGS